MLFVPGWYRKGLFPQPERWFEATGAAVEVTTLMAADSYLNKRKHLPGWLAMMERTSKLFLWRSGTIREFLPIINAKENPAGHALSKWTL